MKQKKYFTAKGDVIDFRDIKIFEDLPTVFGDEKVFNFLFELKKYKFSFWRNKNILFIWVKRWDLLTLKDQLIKLPINNYNQVF